MRRGYRKSKYTDADDVNYADSGFVSDPDPDDQDDAAGVDAEVQIRSTDHLFEVLQDMFPRSTPHELREVWHKYRPNIEAAICHILAQSEQQYPEEEQMQLDDDAVMFDEWPELGQTQHTSNLSAQGWSHQNQPQDHHHHHYQQHQNYQMHYERSYRNCVMRDVGDRWDPRHSSTDNMSDISNTGSGLTFLSSNLPSPSISFSSDPPTDSGF